MRSFHHERQNRDLCLDCKMEGTFIESAQESIRRAGPFREEHYRAFLIEDLQASEQHGCPAAGILPIHRDIEGELHQPADDRKAEKLFLADPLHFPRHVRDQGYVCEGLVIAYDHIRVTWLCDCVAGEVQLPGGVHFRHCHPESTEPAPRAIANRITIEQTNGCQEGEPQEDEKCDCDPDPGRAERRDHPEFSSEESVLSKECNHT